MYYGSKSVVWIPIYLIFLILVIRKFRWQTILVVLVAAVMITVSDQLCNLSKEFFHRLRPSNEPGLMVHLVNAYKGGLYGFYSAHASNTFAIASFLIVINICPNRFFLFAVLLWALFMSYTRIYLGVHYPGDTLVGIIMGSLLGSLFGLMFLWISAKTARDKKIA
jgi:undecaprenyl-diphosphatase